MATKIEVNLILDLKLAASTLAYFKQVLGAQKINFFVFRTQYKTKMFFCALCGGYLRNGKPILTEIGTAALEGLLGLNYGNNVLCLRELKGANTPEVYKKLIETFQQLENYSTIAFIGDMAGMLDEPLSEIIQYGKTLTKKDLKRRSGIPLTLRFDVLKRDNYRCRLCGKSASDDVTLEVDHIIPKARGGDDTVSNLHTLCFDCNRGKGARLL
jgi:hypothetical protein